MNSRNLARSPLQMCADDLKHVRDLLGAPIWEHLAGARILVTGATGFIGKWLLATLIDADQVFGLGCRITAVSRNPGEFERQWPAMIGLIQWIPADVRTIPSIQQCFDIILHAATDVAGATSPQGVFSTCIDGTRRVLELAKQCGAQQLLLVSSGAVYGPLPSGMTHVPETHVGGPDPLLSSSAYAEGKRVSEWLCAQAVPDGLEVKIARVFALVGPHLPLTRHFAIGNFLQAALTNQTIVIEGDGTPYRSYLYAADMAAWLWAVLIEGTPGRAYNVGSDQSLSISDLASLICRLLEIEPRIYIRQKADKGSQPVRYVPDIARARDELGLPAPIDLDEAILRTVRWYSRHGLPAGFPHRSH